MAENGSVPVSDGSEQNGVGSGPAGEPQTEPSPRQPRAEREDAFAFSSWLVEGVVGLCEELRHNDLGLPQEFWTHAYAARREGLLACRALIDTALARCEADAARRDEKPGSQRGRVEID